MTVQELIDALNKLSDEDKRIVVTLATGDYDSKDVAFVVIRQFQPVVLRGLLKDPYSATDNAKAGSRSLVIVAERR